MDIFISTVFLASALSSFNQHQRREENTVANTYFICSTSSKFILWIYALLLFAFIWDKKKKNRIFEIKFKPFGMVCAKCKPWAKNIVNWMRTRRAIDLEPEVYFLFSEFFKTFFSCFIFYGDPPMHSICMNYGLVTVSNIRRKIWRWTKNEVNNV